MESVKSMARAQRDGKAIARTNWTKLAHCPATKQKLQCHLRSDKSLASAGGLEQQAVEGCLSKVGRLSSRSKNAIVRCTEYIRPTINHSGTPTAKSRRIP